MLLSSLRSLVLFNRQLESCSVSHLTAKAGGGETTATDDDRAGGGCFPPPTTNTIIITAAMMNADPTNTIFIFLLTYLLRGGQLPRIGVGSHGLGTTVGEAYG